MSVGYKQFPNKAARQDHLLKESIEEGGGVDLSEIARLEGLITALTTRVEELEGSGDNLEP